ncbi:GGDEF domain-containing protein [Methylobacterium oryzihabitans]|uniref:GGDEF domain-containing protein n=1 Tax=Methylobacterium oryzihabitans TaxID=2499852 RepID=UPI0016522147|nr:sensor domain-containing diguanylate cyclase [Methylobacterium oryzihabitans]
MCALCCSFFGLEVWRAWSERDTEIRRIEETTLTLARSLAQHADDTVGIAGLALGDLVERVEADGMGDRERLTRLMVSAVATMPRLGGLFLFDAEGRWMASSAPASPANANNGDRDYFRRHKADPSPAVAVGQPVRSRSRGHWIIPVSRRIDAPDGSFAGVALVTLAASYFSDTYAPFQIGAKGSITLLGEDATLLSRQPVDESRIGGDSGLGAILHRHLPEAPTGTYAFVSTLDGVERLGGYAGAAHAPLVVVVAAAREEALAPWRRDTLARLGAAGLGSLLVGGLGAWLVRLIRRQEAVEARLQAMATTDGLTGLANRRSLDAALEREWRRAARSGAPVSLLLVDIDHFKAFNDAYGHPEGDACLAAVAGALAGAVRRGGDLAARYGGEEFALLLPGATAEEARRVAEAAREAVARLDRPHAHGPASGRVSVSVGVAAALPGPASAPALLVAAADAALYRAKREGRDRVALAPSLAGFARRAG